MVAPGAPQTGLRAILDLSQFEAATKRLDSLTAGINRTLSNFAKSATSGLKGTTQEMSNMASMSHRIQSIVGGIIIADVFRTGVRAVRELTQETFKAVSQFQKLEIQLETIAARNYSREFGVPVAEAYKMVSGEAKQLLYWIRQTAVTTPFTVENLGSVFALAQAYGFTASEAQRLILAMGNFTSAMGLGDEVLRRIIYNMGQMVAQGKPTGRELRDLSNSFVPIGDIAETLAKKLGVTKAEILDMFKSGAISAKQFIATFEQMAERDYPEAMNRMARTFEGVLNNVKDFFQSLLGYEVLGPIAGKIAGDLQDAITKALSPENYRLAGIAGKAILFVFETLQDTFYTLSVSVSNFANALGFAAPTTLSFANTVMQIGMATRYLVRGLSSGLDEITKFINGIFNYFGTSMSQISSNMFQWGANIIYQLARGIAAGITFVVQALTAVARTITSLLQAHSPPALLPDLENWGAAAMTSWMRGWMKGDFTVFDDIQNLVSKAIESMKITGKSGNEIDIINKVIGTTVDIARAVDQFRRFGSISSDILNSIANSAGFASDEIKSFITKSFEVAKLQTIADAVKDILDFEGIGEINIFGKVVDSFQDLRNMASEFGSELSTLVTQYANDSEALIRINEALASSQKELNDKTEYYDDLLAGLNAQLSKVEDQQEDLSRVKAIDKALTSKILTVDERKRLELEKEQILLKRKIRDTETEKDSVLQGIKDRIKAYEEEKDAVEKKLKFEKETLEKISRSRLEAAKDELDAVRKMIEAQIELNDLMSRAIQIKLSVAGNMEQFADELSDLILGGISKALPTLEEDMTSAFEELWNSIGMAWNAQIEQWKEPFQPIISKWEEFKSTLKSLFDDPKLAASFDSLGKSFDKALKPFTDFWNQNGEAIAKGIGDFFGNLVANIAITNPKTGESFLSILAGAVEKIGKTLQANGPKITKLVEDLGKFVNEVLIPKVKEDLKYIAETVIPKIIEFAINSVPTILDLLTFLVNNSTTIITIIGALKGLEILSAVFNPQVTGTIGVLLRLFIQLGAAILGVGTAAAGLPGAFILLGVSLAVFGPTAANTLSNLQTIINYYFDPKNGRIYDTIKKFGKSVVEKFDEVLGGEGSVKRITKSGITTIDSFFSWAFGIEKGTIITLIKNFGANFNSTVEGLLGTNGVITKLFKSGLTSMTSEFGGTFGPFGSLDLWLSVFKTNSEIFWENLFGKNGIWQGILDGGLSGVVDLFSSYLNQEGNVFSVLKSFETIVTDFMKRVGSEIVDNLALGMEIAFPGITQQVNWIITEINRAIDAINRLTNLNIPTIPPLNPPGGHWENYFDPDYNYGQGGWFRRWVPGKTGLNFIVPGGFPNDSLGLAVSSGEKVKVTPANQVTSALTLGDLPVSSMLSMISSMVSRVSDGWNSPFGAGSRPTTIINNYYDSTSVEVNPTYSQIQSPVTIYSDITAALGASRR